MRRPDPPRAVSPSLNFSLTAADDGFVTADARDDFLPFSGSARRRCRSETARRLVAKVLEIELRDPFDTIVEQ
jgi:hypothetical protein